MNLGRRDTGDKFHFDNYARPQGAKNGNFFEWIVFMNEPQEVLEQVDMVEYRLHETFPNPIRVQTNVEENFALRASGWGTFMIYITVHLKDGSETQETYHLSFSKPWLPEPD
jgi:transcription initiation factor IIF auxiliary subunit